MSKSVVIVESPSKAKTISKYLGKDYIVKASMGHVRDLPVKKLGIDIDNDFRPEYVTIKDKGKFIDEIKKSAKTAKKIYLAPDPDREGEAIAWHIAEELNGNSDRIYRVLFNEITETAIRKAMEHPGRLDLKKVNAQQARRILDRIVGYMLSPLLWEKVRRGLSAGRVQSVAVRLICERESAITSFVTEEYWSITARLEGKLPPPFEAKLFKKGDEEIDIGNGAAAAEVVRLLEGRSFVVKNIEKKEKRRNPVAPFITSRLQQEASQKLKFSPKKTMLLAQQLYEGIEIGDEGPVGLITYMRTDSTRIGEEAQEEVRGYIIEKYGRDYLPAKPPVYKTKKTAQEAHEAIRPTSITRDPEKIKAYLGRDHYNLYKLIWNRFVASQMNPAIMDITRVDIGAGEYLFKATGSIVRFPGFTAVYSEERGEVEQTHGSQEAEEEDGSRLPQLEVGEELRPLNLEPKQHFTQPPPRYTEATLIKELEEKEIGRPSTYAAIVTTIQDRKYVEKVEGKLKPTELGTIVNELLVAHFPNIIDVEFTAKMEEELDEIEEGEKEWVEAVRDFYDPFQDSLKKAGLEMKNVKREEVHTDISCDKCGKKMVIKWGRNGKFLACPGYPECKNTKEFVKKDTGEIEVIDKTEITNEVCDKCGKKMVIKRGRFGRFLACEGYPECQNTRTITTGIKCPEEGCGGELTEKRTKRGKIFYSCTNYPKCKFAIWEKPVPKACPLCKAPFMIEKRSGGEINIQCRTEGCGHKEAETA